MEETNIIKENLNGNTHVSDINKALEINEDGNNIANSGLENTFTKVNFAHLDSLVNREQIMKRIEFYFHERIYALEISDNMKEKEIIDLMFILHDYTKELENIKAEIEKLVSPLHNKFSSTFRTKLFQSKFGKNGEEDHLNRSTFSTVSRRSVSSDRNKGFGFGSGKERFERKLGAQKVEINIDDTEGKQNQKRNRRDTKSVDSSAKQSNRLVKDLKENLNQTTNPKQNEMKTVSSKNMPLSKKNSTIKNVKPNSNSNLTKTTDDNSRLSTSNNTTGKNGMNHTSKVNPFDSKSKKTSSLSMKTNTTTESNYNTMNSPLRPSFKFAPKKKNLSGSGSGIIRVTGNSGANLGTNFSNMTNLFSSPSSIDNQNTVPSIDVDTGLIINKNSFKSDNSQGINQNPFYLQQHLRNNSDNIARMSHLNVTIDKMYSQNTNSALSSFNKTTRFFNDVNNSQIFLKIFEFLKTNQQTKMKNISKTMRDIYLENEINNVSKLIDYKSKQENPFFNIEITSEDIFSKTVNFSELSKKYLNEQGFINLVTVIYIILSKEKIDLDKILIKEYVPEIIKSISMSVNNDANVYSKYKEIIDQLRNNKEIYTTFRQLNHKHPNFFELVINFKSNPEDEESLRIILDLIINIKILLDSANVNLEAILDKEILNHKLEILRSYHNNASAHHAPTLSGTHINLTHSKI